MKLSTVLGALVFPVVALSSSPAQVFLIPQPHRPASLPALSPNEANKVISHHLGLEAFETLDSISYSANEAWHSFLKGGFHGLLHPETGEMMEKKSSMLLVVQSDHPEDFLPKPYRPSFIILSPPPMETFTELISTYTSRAIALFDSVISSLTHSLKDTIHTNSHLKSLLDAFDTATSEGVRSFVDELESLVGFVDSADRKAQTEENNDGFLTRQDQFSSFQMTGLGDVESEFGRESDEYMLATKAVQAVLLHPSLQSQQIALIIVPRTNGFNTHSARSIAPRAVAHPGNLPIYTCFTSAAFCANSTSTCSGRGTCEASVRAGRTCFVCQCGMTTSNDGANKQYWAGERCERKDISSPFVLLVGTTIGILLVAFGSIALLYGIGDQELPSVLTGSVGNGALKRE